MSNLSLMATAVGSLPHNSVKEATDLIWKMFSECPFWPQLAQVSKLEDMIIQYSEGMPGIFIEPENQIFGFNPELEDFCEKIEEFYTDYDEIVEQNNIEKLEKYAIKKPYSNAFEPFIENIKKHRPKYVKAQITGPFTWGTSVTDTDKKCIFYDETYRDIMVKHLSLKALWQIQKIKEASPDTTPIMFMDEPSMSQFGTSAFLTVQREDIIDCFNSISQIIKDAGGISAIHCCGKADWNTILDTNIDIINFDAYNFSKNISVFSGKVEKFIEKKGIMAWGIVPTLDIEGLETSTRDKLIERLEKGFEYLVKKGINKELLLKQSIITPSCGAGCLNVELAVKAMNLTKEISEELIAKYGVN